MTRPLLNDKENQAAFAFMLQHYRKPCCKKIKQFGGTVEVRGTSIGDVVKVKCPYCKAIKDITDYDSW